VVVIDMCSVRADHIGAYGYARDTTPRIDALARDGALFENVSRPRSWCLPNYATAVTPSFEAHGLLHEQAARPPGLRADARRNSQEGRYETAAFAAAST